MKMMPAVTPSRSAEDVRPFRSASVSPYARDAPIPSLVQRVVVVCDGTADTAPRLADAIARSTSAVVRAVTWLPGDLAQIVREKGAIPIEAHLQTVTCQLHRTTTDVGFWRLSLLMGSRERELTRICQEEKAALVILPGTLCDGMVGPGLALRTGVPVACVFDRTDHEVHVIVSAAPDEWSQRVARTAAAIITALRPVRAESAPDQEMLRVDFQTASVADVLTATPTSNVSWVSRTHGGKLSDKQVAMD